MLTKLGAKYIVNASSESFKKDLYKAIEELTFEEAMTPEVIEKYNAKTTGGSIY